MTYYINLYNLDISYAIQHWWLTISRWLAISKPVDLRNSWMPLYPILSKALHCWLENVRNSKKKCSNKPNIFLLPLSISELITSQKFFGTVWPPVGVTITFAKNWNLEMNFFFSEFFLKKMTSRGFLFHFLAKNGC